MRENICIFFGTLILVTATLSPGEPLGIRNQDEANKHDLATAISTNATAGVSYADLRAEWQAANNQAKKDDAISKLFAKLAEIEVIEKSAKDKAKKEAGKDSKK
jgi:hypothetical protein